MNQVEAPLSKSSLLQYGLIALPVAFAGFPIYVLAPDYYASQFGLSLSSLASVLLFLRLIDGLQDPVIGAVSDYLHDKRFSIITLAAILLSVSFWFLFHPLETVWMLFWFALTVFFVSTAYSILVINITALGGIWSCSFHQRTRVAMYREALALVGLLLAVILPTFFMQYYSSATSFAFVSLVLNVLLIVGLVVFLRWYQIHRVDLERRNDEVPAKSTTIRSVVGSYFKKLSSLPSETRCFYLIYGLSMLASSIPAILVIFFVRDYLQAPVYIGLFLSLYFLSGAFGMVIWSRLSQKWDNKLKAWLLAMVLAVLSFIWVLLLNQGDLVAYALICIISGFAFGAELSLPPSILADHIAMQKREKESGFLYSQLTLLTKLSLAGATAVVFPILDSSGFKPADVNDKSSLSVLVICYGLVPCLIKLFSIGFLIRQLHGPHFTKEY
jgi:Na+/melibiose symporter-like transporter